MNHSNITQLLAVTLTSEPTTLILVSPLQFLSPLASSTSCLSSLFSSSLSLSLSHTHTHTHFSLHVFVIPRFNVYTNITYFVYIIKLIHTHTHSHRSMCPSVSWMSYTAVKSRRPRWSPMPNKLQLPCTTFTISWMCCTVTWLQEIYPFSWFFISVVVCVYVRG